MLSFEFIWDCLNILHRRVPLSRSVPVLVAVGTERQVVNKLGRVPLKSRQLTTCVAFSQWEAGHLSVLPPLTGICSLLARENCSRVSVHCPTSIWMHTWTWHCLLPPLSELINKWYSHRGRTMVSCPTEWPVPMIIRRGRGSTSVPTVVWHPWQRTWQEGGNFRL